MDIYDVRNDDPDPETGIDWEEIMAFGIAIVILTLSIVGLVTVIKLFI